MADKRHDVDRWYGNLVKVFNNVFYSEPESREPPKPANAPDLVDKEDSSQKEEDEEISDSSRKEEDEEISDSSLKEEDEEISDSSRKEEDEEISDSSRKEEDEEISDSSRKEEDEEISDSSLKEEDEEISDSSRKEEDEEISDSSRKEEDEEISDSSRKEEDEEISDSSRKEEEEEISDSSRKEEEEEISDSSQKEKDEEISDSSQATAEEHQAQKGCQLKRKANFTHFSEPKRSMKNIAHRVICETSRWFTNTLVPNDRVSELTTYQDTETGRSNQIANDYNYDSFGSQPYASTPVSKTLNIRLHCPGIADTPEIRYLAEMNRVLFLDLENVHFFKIFEGPVPPSTFFWGFVSNRPGQNAVLQTTLKQSLYITLKSQNLVYISTEIGTSKDAADFALCITLIKLDDRLPKSVTFWIVSRDRGFIEVESQLKFSGRRVKIVSPGRTEKINSTMFL